MTTTTTPSSQPRRPAGGVQVRAQDKFPCVFKIGHAHGGLGKVRVDNQGSFQVGSQRLEGGLEFLEIMVQLVTNRL